jgi:hypothetical protein
MANKIITTVGRVAAGLAALSLVAAATTASADSRYRHYRGHDRGNGAATAVAAGIVGLAIGAAISDGNRNDRYDRGYYDQGYYAPPPPPPRYHGGYGYAPRPYYGGGGRDCWTTREYDRWNGTYYERTVCR